MFFTKIHNISSLRRLVNLSGILFGFSLVQCSSVCAGEAEFVQYNHAGEKAAASFKWQEAEIQFRKAFLEAKHFSKRDYQLQMIIVNLADSLKNQNKYVEAEYLYKQFLTLKQKYTGINSLDSGLAMFKLAQVYESQPGQYNDAIALLKRDILINKKELRENSPEVRRLNAYLADSLWMHHRYSDAIPVYKQTLTDCQTVGPYEEINKGFLFSNMSHCYANLGQYNDALDASRKSFTLLSKHYKPTDSAITNCSKNQEQILRAMSTEKTDKP
jgi:tetratricopeptide (TPR) repeat protein